MPSSEVRVNQITYKTGLGLEVDNVVKVARVVAIPFVFRLQHLIVGAVRVLFQSAMDEDTDELAFSHYYAI